MNIESQAWQTPKSGTATARDALAANLEAKSIVGFWKIRSQFEEMEPRPAEQPAIWSRADYEKLGAEAGQLIPVEEADRRNLMFANPGLAGAPFITNGLFGGVQVINPGEVAPVHRHTGCASRLHLKGKGGYTTVEGHKYMLEPGDVVINPNWAWHENGNEGSETIMWFDVLDIPFTRAMAGNFFENDYKEHNGAGHQRRQFQTIKDSQDWSAVAYGTGGLRPSYAAPTAGGAHGGPQMMFKYEATRALLHRLRGDAGDPWRGIAVDYFSADHGGDVMTTLGISAELVQGSEQRRDWRSTAAQVYCCIEGSGKTLTPLGSMDWQAGDIWVVPAWCWHHHQSAMATDAVVYSVSLAPALRQLGLLRVEGKEKDGASRLLNA